MTPLVSIIIPAYNSEIFLSETIDSILGQTYANWELIIIDDGSKDATFALSKQFEEQDARIRAVQKPNGGVVSALNRGLSELSEESFGVITFGHDDVMKSNLVECLVNELIRNEKAVLASALGSYIDAGGELFRPGEMEHHYSERFSVQNGKAISLPLTNRIDFEMLAVRNYIPAGGAIFKKAVLEQTGGFLTGCDGSEDWHLWLRFSQEGEIVFVNEALYLYRRHDKNITNNSEFMGKSQIFMIRDLVKSGKLSKTQIEALIVGYHFRNSLQEIRYRREWAMNNLKEIKLVEAAKQFRHVVKLMLQKKENSRRFLEAIEVGS